MDEAEVKAKREEVLNQLLLMLNTAVEEQKERPKGSAAPQAAGGGEEGEIEYLQGSLGLVPIQK